jgi:hypothetical protein
MGFHMDEGFVEGWPDRGLVKALWGDLLLLGFPTRLAQQCPAFVLESFGPIRFSEMLVIRRQREVEGPSGGFHLER